MFSTDRAMTCSHGGLTITRHNDIHDITANWLSEVCRNVERDPPPPHCLSQVKTSCHFLQTDVTMREQTFVQQASGDGSNACAFFDIRVFHPNAQSYRHSSISSLYWRHELTKKREYGDRIREVENSSFTPLVFATTGGMGREAILFYKDQISEKRNTIYSKTMAWIRCTLSFSLLRSAVMCI